MLLSMRAKIASEPSPSPARRSTRRSPRTGSRTSGNRGDRRLAIGENQCADLFAVLERWRSRRERGEIVRYRRAVPSTPASIVAANAAIKLMTEHA